jgi:hypothetical protein
MTWCVQELARQTEWHRSRTNGCPCNKSTPTGMHKNTLQNLDTNVASSKQSQQF